MFNKSLNQLDYQFIGFFLVIGLCAINISLKTDIITGFLSGIGMMMGRHLYRNSNNQKNNSLVNKFWNIYGRRRK